MASRNMTVGLMSGALAVSVLCGCSRGGESGPAVSHVPIVRYLSTVVALSALDDETVDGLREMIAALESATVTDAAVLSTLNGVRDASNELLGALIGEADPDSIPVGANVRSLVDVLTMSEVVAAAFGVEVLGAKTHIDHRCERRVGDTQAQCYAEKRHNCRNTRWGCITVKKP